MAADAFGLTQANITLQSALDACTDTDVCALLNLVQLGSIMTPVVAAVSGITSSATVHVTVGAAAAAGNLGGGTVALTNPPVGGVFAGTTAIVGGTGNTLPPILTVIGLAVTTGAYLVAPVGATVFAPTAGSVVGCATLSADGKTLVLGTAGTAFTINYLAQPMTAIATKFEDFNQF
jgi:hypothetical protein